MVLEGWGGPGRSPNELSRECAGNEEPGKFVKQRRLAVWCRGNGSGESRIPDTGRRGGEGGRAGTGRLMAH